MGVDKERLSHQWQRHEVKRGPLTNGEDMGREGAKRSAIVPPDDLAGIESPDFLIWIDSQEDVGHVGLDGGKEGRENSFKGR